MKTLYQFVIAIAAVLLPIQTVMAQTTRSVIVNTNTLLTTGFIPYAVSGVRVAPGPIARVDASTVAVSNQVLSATLTRGTTALSGPAATIDWDTSDRYTWTISAASTGTHANVPTGGGTVQNVSLTVTSPGGLTIDFVFPVGVTTNWVSNFVRIPRAGQTEFGFSPRGSIMDIWAVPDAYATADGEVYRRASGTNGFGAITGTGDVVGPASAFDNAIVRFDGVTGKLVQNSLATISDAGAFTFSPGVRQTFNPDGTTPGFNVGSVAGDPSTPINGDLWYDETLELLRARINGSTVSLGAGGSGGDTLWHNVASAATLTNTMETLVFGHDTSAGDDDNIAIDLFSTTSSAFTNYGNIYGPISTTSAQLNVLTRVAGAQSGVVRLISGNGTAQITAEVDGGTRFLDVMRDTLFFESQAANNATNAALVINSASAWSAFGALLGAYQSNGTNVFEVDRKGSLVVGRYSRDLYENIYNSVGQDSIVSIRDGTLEDPNNYTMLGTYNGSTYSIIYGHTTDGVASLRVFGSDSANGHDLGSDTLNTSYTLYHGGNVLVYLQPTVESSGSAVAHSLDTSNVLTNGDSILLAANTGVTHFRVAGNSGYGGSGTLFLSDDGTYKLPSTSSAANWTASGTTNSLLSGVARSYGSFATNETIFNVKNFGAVGNGTTDDSAAIQSAITAANATQGGMVMIPSGVYAIASTIEVLDKPNVRLIGVGARHGIYNAAVPTNGTVLKWTGATNLPMVKVGSTVASTTSVPGNGVEGIAFDANGIADTGLLIVSSWHGIYRDLFIMDCRTVGLDVTTIDLTSTEDTQGCEFENISVKATSVWGVDGIGIRLGSFATGGGNTSLNVWSDTSVYHSNGTGILLGDSDSNTFINTRVNRTSGTGVGIILSGSSTLGSGHCRDNAFYFVQPISGLTSKGTALTQPAINNYILYSFGNSSPTPTVETGSSLWGMSTRGSIPVNNVALMGRNAAGTDDLPIIKLNAANETEISTIWRLNAAGTIGNGVNIVLGTTTGTKIGTGTTQKMGFYNATPIVQPASTTDLRQALINLGFLATGGATPLDLNGGALTAATVTAGGVNVMSREFLLACSDLTTAITAGTGKAYFYTPYACTVTRVKATLDTPQTSGATFTVDINEAGVSILSTKLTIDNTEPTSITAAVPPVISDTALADNAKITIDVDGIGDGTAKGLIVEIDVTRP